MDRVVLHRMVSKARVAAAAFAALALASAGCSKTVLVTIPPRVDLREFPTVGVVHFEAGGEASPDEEVMHRFLATLQSSQPGTRLLELGREAEVLGTVGCPKMDLNAVKAIGAHYGVEALLTGRLEVSRPQARLAIGQSLDSLSAGAAVNGSLQARLQETRTGATVWTNGAHGTWNVASLHLDSQGSLGGLRVSDPARRYDAMVSDLVEVATQDFRPTYQRQKAAP